MFISPFFAFGPFWSDPWKDRHQRDTANYSDMKPITSEEAKQVAVRLRTRWIEGIGYDSGVPLDDQPHRVIAAFARLSFHK